VGEESRQRGLKTLTDPLSPSYYAEAQLMLKLLAYNAQRVQLTPKVFYNAEGVR